MSAQSNFKLLLCCILLVAFVGCGKDDKKSSPAQQAQQDAVCSGLECLEQVTWKLQMEGRNYPAKSRVDVNGVTVLDECLTKQKYFIDRSKNPQVLALDNYLIPTRGQVRIQVVDQGLVCKLEETVLLNEDAQWEETKGENGADEIIFHL